MYAHKRTMYLLVLKLVLSHYLIAFTPIGHIEALSSRQGSFKADNFTYYYYTMSP
jgi:hypothetical protein